MASLARSPPSTTALSSCSMAGLQTMPRRASSQVSSGWFRVAGLPRPTPQAWLLAANGDRLARRLLHSSSTKSTLSTTRNFTPLAATADSEATQSSAPSEPDEPVPAMAKRIPPLAVLPLKSVIRSWMVTTISSSPVLLPPSLAIMSALAHTTSPALNPDRNPLLRFLLKKTFYAQFCAGENAGEVHRTMAELKGIGFSGVILGYAREVVLTEAQTRDLDGGSCVGQGAEADECVRTEVAPWAAGTMETVRMAEKGDFVAVKFTGAGRQALYALSKGLPPGAELAGAIEAICEEAKARGVRLLFDAEQQAVQGGIDRWSLEYMRRYNRGDRSVVYGTYQAYLKGTPATLRNHLEVASDEGFMLGVKLVRGAYLGSDPRVLINDTKAETDAAYDGIAEALLTRSWSGPLALPGSEKSSNARFPTVDLVLATHNRESVLRAREILQTQGSAAGTRVAFGQLQGMADEVSCELVASNKENIGSTKDEAKDKLHAYKYLVWGSTGECMKYLLRRAHENRDAVQRTRDGRDAMGREIMRRFKAFFGLSG